MGYYETVDGKLVPKQKQNWHPKATIPAGLTEVERPMKIYVTASNGFSLKFGSGSDYVNMGTMAAGIYDLQPIAWSGSNANSAAGDVVFLYKGDM